MRNIITLLLTAAGCSAQVSFTATLTPENGGNKTRISWELATYDVFFVLPSPIPNWQGVYFPGGNSTTSRAFDTQPSPSSFSLTTDIVYTNLTTSQSFTANTLNFVAFTSSDDTSFSFLGLINPTDGLTISNNDSVRVTGSPTGTFVFDIDFSLFNAGTYWDGGPQLLIVSGTPIPEPSTYGLILGGLAFAGAAIRRRRKQAA